jgi:Tfp pilus assembly protein PilO
MEKRTISSIFLLLFSVFFSYFFLWPKYNQFLVLKEGIKKLEKILASHQEYFKEIEDKFSQVQEKKEEISKIETAFPHDPYVAETLNFLQKTAAENGLLIKSFSFVLTETSQKEGIGELRIQISLSGFYESFKNFLRKIERSARLIEVEKTSLSVGGEEGAEGILNFSLDLKSFYLLK